MAFLVAHEAGHIAAGDCMPDQPVVDADEEEEVGDDAEIERKADRYATRTLVGSDLVPPVDGESFKELASRASQLERTRGADASVILLAWAARTRDYATATMAVKALYRGTGARRQLRQHFDRHVDLEAATESDRALLRCVHGEPEDDAAVG
jgi:Zn-dependent peptidase ImmA (M78 family)